MGRGEDILVFDCCEDTPLMETFLLWNMNTYSTPVLLIFAAVAQPKRFDSRVLTFTVNSMFEIAQHVFFGERILQNWCMQLPEKLHHKEYCNRWMLGDCTGTHWYSQQ